MAAITNFSDLIQLPDDRTDAICKHLRTRYENNQLYTYIGNEHMVVVNPCKPVPALVDSEVLQFYTNQGYKDLSVSLNGFPSAEPHICELATKMYFILRRRKEDQLALLSGISGSGKSTSHQHLVNTILTLSTHTRREEKLQKQISSALTILESFGSIHATTSSQVHHSSNKFNLCHTLQFNDRGHISGTYFAISLFDKYHVTRTNTTSNYHIFYQLLAGTSLDEKTALHINYSVSHFNYLKNTTRYKNTNDNNDGDLDQTQFIKVKEALKALGFKAKVIAQICQLLGAILHLGNVQFVDNRGPLSVLSTQNNSSGQESCRIKNKDIVALVAAALGVATAKLENTLTNKLKLIGKEFCSAFLTADTAAEQRDNLARSLYTLLFQWIICCINDKLSGSSYSNRITIVDFISQMSGLINPSVYNPNNNASYQQHLQRQCNFYDLCTHFATEQIHQWMINEAFDVGSNINMFRYQDGLSVAPSPSPDFFQTSLPLWYGDNKFTIVPSLDKECQRFQSYALDATDCNWLTNIFQKKKRQGDNNGPFTALLSPSSLSSSFAIKHFTTVVDYSVEGFLESNVDAFSPDFIHLFRYNCTNNFVRELFISREAVQPPTDKKNGNNSNNNNGKTIDDHHHHQKENDSGTNDHGNKINNDKDSKPNILLTESHPRDELTIIKSQLPTQPINGWLGILSDNTNTNTNNNNIEDNETSNAAEDKNYVEKNQENENNNSIYAKDKSLCYINTVTQQMVHSMDQLLNIFKNTPRIFEIIHIQSNPAFQPSTFDDSWVLEQLNAFKVMEHTKRKRWCETSFAYDLYYFVERYQNLMSSLPLDSDLNIYGQLECLREIMQWSSTQCEIGHSNIWLRYDIWHDLENHLRILEKEERQREKERLAQLEAERKAEEEAQRQMELEAAAQAQAEAELAQSQLDLTNDNNNNDQWSHSNPFTDDGRSDWSSDEHTAQDRSDWEEDEDEDAKELALAYGPNLDMSQMVEDYKVHTEEHIEEVPITSIRQWWSRFVWLATWWIPSYTLKWIGKMDRQDVQMAWREKVTLCLLIFLFSGSIIFVIVGLNEIICPGTKYLFSSNDVSGHQTFKDFWVSIHGQVYDLTKFVANDHGTAMYAATQSAMEPLAGRDLSYTFPMPLTSSCPDLVTENAITIIPNETIVLGPFVHLSGAQQPNNGLTSLKDPLWLKNTFYPHIEKYRKGDLVIPMKQLQEDFKSYGRLAVVIHERVYDITDYMATARKYPHGSVPNYHFFHSSVERIFTTFAGKDATQAWEQMILDPATKQANLACLDNAFYTGRLDYRDTPKCTVVNYLLLSFAVIMSVVILVKFLAALQFGGAPSPEEQDKFVICQVPCYTEDEDSLRKTIESITVTQYDDRRKLLLLIADGMIIGSGNDKPTPKILLDILGHEENENDDTTESFMFKSIGEGSQQLNYGKVYSGLYHHEGHSVPYVVVVKVGKSSERTKPGNRGKRDSQIICMNFLNKVHFDAPMNPLELEMYRHIQHVIGIDPALYEYILMVDSDTEVYPDALTRMISCMLHDSRIIGLCGETELCNEDRSWATRIQVYEYYISHHLVKAFESLFGSVTCLPGCFCMYRIRTPHKKLPLIISPQVIHGYSDNRVDTLHKKNLLHLGEDRYLTTLVMKNFPQYKMMFTPYAKCKTVAPDEWRVLLSQRRRWINSTIHNLLELVLLQELCGFCCLSMRFVVMTDLIGTITLPSSVVYLFYLIYQSVSGTGPLPVIALGMLAGAYGLQALIFIIKRQWQHFGWMVIYVLAIPIFSFFIPIYAFWHFDDFSWGNTRVVVGDNKKKQIIVTTDGEKFDEKMIPLKKWGQHEQELWERRYLEQMERSLNSRRSSINSSSSSATTKQKSSNEKDSKGNHPLLLQPLIMDFSLNDDKDFSLADLTAAAFPKTLNNEKSGMNTPLGNYNNNGDDNDNDGECNNNGSQFIVLPKDEDIELEIKKILLTSNLMNLTKKQVRDQLSQIYGVDLTIKKGFINATIEKIIETEFS